MLFRSFSQVTVITKRKSQILGRCNEFIISVLQREKERLSFRNRHEYVSKHQYPLPATEPRSLTLALFLEFVDQLLFPSVRCQEYNGINTIPVPNRTTIH